MFIGQVLANILDNAAKYAGPEAPIRVAAQSSRERRASRSRSRTAGRACRPSPCRACSRSSIASRARARARGAARASAWPSSGASIEAMGGHGRGPAERAGWAGRRHRPARVAPDGAAGGRREPADAADRCTGAAAAILLVEDDEPTRHVDRHVPARVTATTSSRPATPRPRLAAWERAPAGPHRPRPGPARPGRPRRVIRRVRREATTPILVLSARDREADKVARARPRRRRLRDQAVRHGRAAGPDRRPAAPRGRAGRGPRRATVQVGTLPHGRRRGDSVTVGRHAGPPDAARVRGPQGPARARRAGWSPTAACCARSGGRRTATRRTTSTSTSARSGARSTRADPDGTLRGLIVAEPGVGYRVAAA